MPNRDPRGSDLLQQDGGLPDADTVACEARAAAQGKLRRWFITTGVSWLLTAGYLFALIYAYHVYVHPVWHAHFANDGGNPEQLKLLPRVMDYFIRGFLLWPVLLLISALSTTVLIIKSRRATLQQIQESLATISRRMGTA